ncbi:MAG TPA: site-2 protease family protein, partial [Alphaproteobacteria bacterium]|nr:site-2 protease family protein [Alphaproteobacteria bacterium]
MALLSSVVPFIIVLSILVFVHELGHFLSARRHGVKVEVFSIGFGAELFGFNDAKGTRWKFSLIPLGGYVKMLGDADASSRPDEATLQQLSEEEKKQTLNSKSVYQRIEVSFAGPLANFVFAIFLMMGLFYFKGLPEVPAVIGKVSTEGVANQ